MSRSRYTLRMSSVFSERLHAAFAPPRYIAQSYSGIDLSTSGVRAVRLAKKAHGMVIAGYSEMRLPDGAFSDGEIVDRPTVIKTIARVAKGAGITAAHVSLPESKSYLFETTALGTDPVEWRTTIEQHLDELIPLPPAETSFDVVEVGHDPNGDSRVVGIGFARRIIDDTLSVFDQAGIEVQSLEGETFASARALLAPDDESTTLIIDAGKATTRISIVARRIPHFATTINIGGHALTLAVQKYFGVTEDEALKVKIERGIASAAGNEDYLAAMLSTVSALRDEISRCFDYWRERVMPTQAYGPISRVLIVGGNAAVRGLPEYLEGSLKIPITAGDVFVNLAPRTTWHSPLNHVESLSYATAIGLALRDYTQPHD